MNDSGKFDRRGSPAARELFQTAQRLFIAGKHRESIAAFTEFIAMRGETEIALLSRGVSYLKTGQLDKSIEDFRIVITINPDNFRAYFYRGTAYMAAEDFEKAITDFDRTIELQPDYGAAFFARGSAYAQIGNKYEAVRNIRTAITFSDAGSQGFTETFGLFKIPFDKALSAMADTQNAPKNLLSENEIKAVRKWLATGNQ